MVPNTSVSYKLSQELEEELTVSSD